MNLFLPSETKELRLCRRPPASLQMNPVKGSRLREPCSAWMVANPVIAQSSRKQQERRPKAALFLENG